MEKTDLTEISPITGNTSVIVETDDNGVESRICMDSGYTTTSKYKIGSKHIEEYEQTTAKVIKELRYEDKKLNQYWYLTTVMFTHGMIYPDGDLENWQWCYAPIIELNEEESKNYPIPGKDGEFYTSRLGVDVAEFYPKDRFAEVCIRAGIAKEVETNG